MWKLLAKLKKNMVLSIPLAMILGAAAGSAADVSWLKSLIVPFTFLMIYPMMTKMDTKEVLGRGNMKLQLTTQMINFILMPTIGVMVGRIFFPESEYVILGLLLISLLPTSGMTISWTGFANGNVSESIKMTLIGLFAGSILSPVYIKYIMGRSIEISTSKIFFQILMFVLIPALAGFATKKAVESYMGEQFFKEKFSSKMPLLSTLGVLGMVFCAIALKADMLISNPYMVLSYIWPVILMYAVFFLITTLIGKLAFRRSDAIALVYGTSMRNLSIALALAMLSFGPAGSEMALFLAVAYVVQVQLGAWYGKMTDRIFGCAA